MFGTGTLKVDGTVVSKRTMDRTVPLTLPWDETFDIGSDTGTPVDDHDYQVPFSFTVSLRSGPPFQNRGKCDAAQLSRLYQRG